MNRMTLAGCCVSVVVLLAVSFFPVATARSYKVTDDTFNTFVDGFISRIQEDERLKDDGINEMADTFQYLEDNLNAFKGSWFPGQLVVLIIIVVLGLLILEIIQALLWLILAPRGPPQYN